MIQRVLCLYFLSIVACGTMMETTHSEFRPADPEDLLARLAAEPQRPNAKVDRFAVLIGANTELRHRGNLSMAYQVLLEQGYTRQQIYVFDSEGSAPYYPVTDLTTRAAIHQMFTHLERVVEPQDSLFIYVTGHGRRILAEEESNGDPRLLGVSTLLLNPSEEMTQDEFFHYLEAIRPEVGIAFFDQCYWGQYASKKMCNYITITTAEQEVTSHGVSFPRAFWEAFRQPARDEVLEHPLSVFDAFKRAMVTDKATRLGKNRPKISYGCVNPGEILLTGAPRVEPTPAPVQAAAEHHVPAPGETRP